MFDLLTEKFSSLFSRIKGGMASEKTIDITLKTIWEGLIESDVPYDVAQAFINDIKTEVTAKNKNIKTSEQLIKIVHDKILSFLGSQGSETTFAFSIPATVMVVGLQGSGKTTTLAKLASYIMREAAKRGKQRRILLASVDFYRPAAIDQLEILARNAQVDFYRALETNPIKAAQEIVAYSTKNQYELCLLDTAGRLHVDEMMLDEIKKIESLIKPKYKLLVIDAMIGQESLAVAQAFEKAIGITGAILTKTDSSTRAGIALAFKYTLKKPILFIGTGEKREDLELFYPERVASRLIGMGDLTSLLEKAQEKIKENDQERLYSSLSKGTINLQDFADQLDMVNKLGSFTSIMKYLPGMGGLKISPDMLEKSSIEAKKYRVIINSMTPKERRNTRLIDGSRKKRIALGAGVLPQDVTQLLARFEQIQQSAKIFKKMGRF